MTKVLRIINRLNLGGPTFNAAYLSKYLTPEFETLLVAGMIDETEESSDFIVKEMGLHTVYISEMFRDIHLLKDFRAYKQLKKIISEFKPDIVHTHAAKAGTLGRLAAANGNVPVIIHTFHGHVFHSYFSPWKTNLFIQIERYLARKSTRIVAISETQKKELAAVYHICPEEKIEVIPLGFDLQKFSEHLPQKRKKFRSYYQIDDDEIVIVIVGRLVPVKNHGLFLRALRSVIASTGKKVRAFIVGDGEERNRLERLAADLGIDYTYYPNHQVKATLTFTSWIKEVDEVYAGADIVTLTSFNEGTPVSLIEAQAAGKPIVTTDAGGIADIVIPGETAFIVENNDEALFIEKLLQLTEDKDLRLHRSATASAKVAEQFRYQRLVDDTAALYRSLLNEAGKR